MLKSIPEILKQHQLLSSMTVNKGKKSNVDHCTNDASTHFLSQLLMAPLLLVFTILAVVLLSGCGQSGDLYYVEDAPSNTEFILYDNPKLKDSHTSQDEESIDKAAVDDANQKVAEQQPDDY